MRNRKGRGRLHIPYVTPKEKLITNAKQLKEFIDAVDDDLQRVIESIRTQEEEFENREQARREEEARQEHIRRNTRPTGFNYQTITSTPLRTQAPYPTTSSNTNRHTSRGVFFDPNPTRHSYTQAGETNSNDDYDQISGDSMSQDTDMNDRISPQATETQTANEETIGNKIKQQAMELARLEELVVQVSKMNIHSTHREIQSRATDAENRVTSVQDVWYQRYTAPFAEHQTMVPGLAEGTTLQTTAHQTATAVQNTIPRLPHHKAKQTDCSHLQE